MKFAKENQSIGTIAFAEDDKNIRDVIAEYLEMEGYKVVSFDDGATLLQTLNSVVILPDVIITDLNMRGTDGFQVIETVHASKRLHVIPIIAITGSDTCPSDVIVIRKPFNLDHLLDRIEYVMHNTAGRKLAAA